MKSRFNNTLLTSMETEYKSMAILTDRREGYVFIAKIKSISFKMKDFTFLQQLLNIQNLLLT
jgi:hypothetical protein